ncbi:putative ribosome-binding factor A [Blattabacterium sp. (Blattella germanica) str. Bge]|uniref:ribosome-binding factor A n=1 Tax=Blattabacterium sp. (Blattella germanica) TaxID=624186 RepID=UPI0001BB62C1|nr:ribosome-binding factor A [Blattabacterium sp. (Blattella germanica)]ACY40065.1 putative ribosome-binding factor A [Blattabacterium sp. (Blattella germanica) str. Bge]
MKEMNFIRNEKLSSMFSIEIAEILNEEIRNKRNKNNEKFLVTLIKVCINTDMNFMKVYISIYPSFNKKILEFIRSKSGFYRKLLSQRLRYRVKKIPKLDFCALIKD